MALTAERVRELFDYSPVTGLLYSRHARGSHGRVPAGTPILCARLYHPDGRPKYAQFEIDGKHYYHHRVIWLWVTGELPDKVDHENRDICCNAWHNLREATTSENGCNRGKQKNNKSGYKGVCWLKTKGKWKAQIRIRGKVYNLGNYDTPEEARDAYNAKCLELHGDFARHD